MNSQIDLEKVIELMIEFNQRVQQLENEADEIELQLSQAIDLERMEIKKEVSKIFEGKTQGAVILAIQDIFVKQLLKLEAFDKSIKHHRSDKIH